MVPRCFDQHPFRVCVAASTTRQAHTAKEATVPAQLPHTKSQNLVQCFQVCVLDYLVSTKSAHKIGCWHHQRAAVGAWASRPCRARPLPRIIRPAVPPRAGRFGFVEMRTPELASSAMALDKVELCGRNINVGRPKGYVEPPAVGRGFRGT